MKIEDSDGYLRLKASVMEDCSRGEDCFNPDGCNKQQGCIKCFHRYCDTFKWVIDRANHYSEKLGIPATQILDSWEKSRDYWYMNYYQNCNQPLIETDQVRVFDTVDDMLKAFGEPKFRCPFCGGISSSPYECNSGLTVEIIGQTSVCNWKVYGLFLGKGIYVFCKDKLRGETIFMPVAWEKQEEVG